MADFLPRADADVLQFSRNFAQKIQQDPAALGLSAQQAADYAVLQQGFAEALRAATQPATRGVRTVMEKDTARRALVAETRVLARIVRAQPGVAKTTLMSLGLLKAGGEAVGSAGDAPPVEQVQGPRVSMRADSRRVEVSVSRWDGRRKRPTGSVGAAVYWAVGDDYPRTLDRFTMAGNTTKPAMSFVLSEEVAPPGTRVWVTACWLDARLQPGQPSKPVSARVGYGSLLKAA